MTKRSEAPESANSLVRKKTTVQEKKEFMSCFDIISRDLIDDLELYRLPKDGQEWLKAMIQETIPGGKMNRGLTVASSLASILKRNLTKAEQFDADALGWCIEMVFIYIDFLGNPQCHLYLQLQAFFLIQDDIMDSSITRRGQPCWYKRVCSCKTHLGICWDGRNQR